ncbi:MAG: multidrug effflux MFS transporter [Rhodomicrobium sp.]|nr:multidrug effflux MFS transporter [Rhodomicrobium sp.]
MLQTPAEPGRPDETRLPFAEFVTLIALMMALTALSVDIMLPALGTIGNDLGLDADNDRQLIIIVYLAGFAAGQVVFGPLSDRFGRKRPLYAGLAVYALASIAAAQADSAATMFAARALQGVGAAAPRIIAIAIVRDRFAGRQMARVMSFVMMVFIVTPILAPSLGESVMHLAPWRAIFAILFLASLVTLAWAALRLAETHPPELRLPLTPGRLSAALVTVVTTRQTAGYAIGFGFFFGVLMSYIASAEQIFVDVYGLGKSFPLVFGAIASVMIAAALINARLVGTFGMRRVSHIALLAFIGVCGVMALFGYPQKPPLALFCLFIASAFFCFGLIGPNFNALAMEPVGHIAGTASSFIGFYTTGAGAIFGYLVGQSFDGTVRPLAIGFSLLAIGALIAVLITERGRLACSR